MCFTCPDVEARVELVYLGREIDAPDFAGSERRRGRSSEEGGDEW